MVERPEPLPGVVAAVGSAHQVLDDQSDVDEADAVVWRQVALHGERPGPFVLHTTPTQLLDASSRTSTVDGQ